MYFWAVVVAVFGIIIGSFLNVVILRYNTGRGLNGRSGCLSCGKGLSWLELIPVISFFVQKRRCVGCGSKVSWQYPLVELATASMFVAIFFRQIDLFFGHNPIEFFISFIFFAVIWSILIVIFVYDLRHKIIPNGLAYTFAILTLVYTLISIPISNWFAMPQLLDVFAGIIFFIPFFLLWFVSGGRWIGLGDGKLALGIGWLLGFVTGVSSIFVAFWLGALVSIMLLILTRLKSRGSNITMKTEVPFAPFLIIGTLIGFFFEFDVIGISLLLSF